MKWKGRFGLVCATHALVALLSISTAASERLAHWDFEQVQDSSLRERAGRVADTIHGHWKQVTGAQGRGLWFDGFTTCVQRQAGQAPALGNTWAITAWIAPHAYPWGWCPIVSQHQNRQRGYFFGLDAEGHIGLHLFVNGKWRSFVTGDKVPYRQWSFIAGIYDGQQGVRIHINERVAGTWSLTGTPVYAPDVDLLVGNNHTKEPAQFSGYWERPDQAIHFCFDGIMDEIQIWGHAVDPDQILALYQKSKPSAPPELEPRRLPAGPEKANQFGAFYCPLKYTEAWDRQWRHTGPDVVVSLGQSAGRLVFWRGISYAPCWVTENGIWFNNEFMERGIDRKQRGCSESMSDKKAAFSHVKILESSPARAVVYWRNAPVGVHDEMAYPDPQTGWGDWSEEYHTIYPDGVAVRKVVVWSSDLESWYEWCQSLPILHPGQRPEDILDQNKVLSVATMQGQTCTYPWQWRDREALRLEKFPTLPGANIQIVHLKSRYQPFLILDDRDGPNKHRTRGAVITRYGGSSSRYSIYPWRNHWPVTQPPLIGRYAVAPDRPSHTYTSTQYSAPYEQTDQYHTKIMLCGLTDKPALDLLPLAKSWLRAPALALKQTRGAAYEGYDPTQRAYRFRLSDQSCEALEFDISATDQSPLVNLALVIEKWGQAPVQISQNGKPLVSGKDFSCGYCPQLAAPAQLVVWVNVETCRAVRFIIRKAR